MMMEDSRAVRPAQAEEAPFDPPAVSVESLVHERGGARLLDSVSLAVPAGQYVALMGANGSGKTTLIRHLNGMLRPTSGSVHTFGLDASDEANLARVRAAVGVVFQDPDDQMVAVTVEDEIAFGLENRQWERGRMQARIDEALERFTLLHVRERQTTSLSGGEQQRVAIAAVWAADPALLVLDEPTSMLDFASAHALLDLLDDVAGDRTVVHVTQNVEEARRSGRVVVMDAGRVVLDGSPEDVLADRGRIEALGIVRREGRRTRPLSSGGATALEAVEIVHTRRDGPERREVLHGVSLRADAGRIVAVVGASGSGKTTLAWHFNRLLEPDSGEIRLGLRRARDLPVSEVRRAVGFTFQRVDLQLFEATVLEDVAFGLIARGIKPDEAKEHAREALDAVGLPSERYAGRRPVTLSVGEQRRVALAGVLVTQPSVLVFDEPTSGLDARGADAFADELCRLRELGKCIVVVTHDLGFARELADRVLVMREGTGEQSDEVAIAVERLVAS